MQINQNIFRAYDIRGIASEDLSDEFVASLGSALSHKIKKLGLKQVAVARDGRLSGKRIYSVLIKSFIDNGINVKNVGMVPSPLLYFAVEKFNTKNGVMITGSHNPKEYNGLKLCNSGAVPIGEHSGLLEIKNNIKNIDLGVISNLNLETNNELDLYFEHIQKLVKPEKVNSQIKFGVDGGNGAIGSIFEDLSKIYNFDCEKLYMEVDGNFPNHPADPSNIDNLKEIIKLVQEKKLDFGVAFDGDADRAVFIDDTGKVISGSMMTTLIADYLSRKKE